MKHNNIILSLLVCAVMSVSCVDLDVSPKNIVTDDDLLSNESGMDIYLASLYSYMPFEDFKYMGEWGYNFNGWLGCTGIEGTGESVNRDGICRTFTSEDTPYWGMAFTELRNVNYLIENLPKFKENFPQESYDHYMGEGYFIRAFVFYAMAKRFGGVPLVTHVIDYPADSSKLEVPRSSEEETWNQILNDFDSAALLLPPNSLKSGYANKYVALAWKAEAMQYAGCVAKYNETVSGRLTGLGAKTGVRVIGFDQDSWLPASKKYFREAYLAAREIMNSGVYSLYKKKWAADDPQAQYENMVSMFSDLTSPENIFVKTYDYPTTSHGYDAYSSPFIFHYPLSAGTCPTLDFVELFDGFDRYPDGHIRVTTGNSYNQGEYILYDNTMDFFKSAEPRLRAYVIFPGDSFKGQVIETRGGVYTGSVPVKPLFDDYSYNKADQNYQQLGAYTKKPKTLYLSPYSGNSQEIVTLDDGSTMTAAGANGPFYGDGESNPTGLYGRKWLNPDPSFVIGEGKSSQPFILMRYADVLLIAAESGVELAMSGEASPDGSDLLQVATDNVNAIRERAGASLLTGRLSADEDGRDIVRRERRKELAFEHKTKWDLRRWRVQHYEGRDEFWCEKRDKDEYSSGSNYRFRGIYPFYSTVAGKYFYDAHYQWISLKTFSYSPIDYYFEIPSGEVSKSSYIDQQPNR